MMHFSANEKETTALSREVNAAFVKSLPLLAAPSSTGRQLPSRCPRSVRLPVFAKMDGSYPGREGAKTYRVTVEDPHKGILHEYDVPEDRYIWYSMSDAGADIPSSCRHGCCTTCAVKIKSGTVKQDEALGLLKEMRADGYALLCVSYPRSDIRCVLQEKDEVYIKQFGASFESGGVDWGGVMPEDD